MKKWKIASLFLAMVMMLAACGGGKTGTTKDGKTSGKTDANGQPVAQVELPNKIDQKEKAVDGGALKVAYASDANFKGVLNGFFSLDANDGAMTEDAMNGAFPIDKDFKIIADSKDTPMNVHFDEKAKSVTLKINPKFKWSDGSPFTTKDIIKTYEIMANQEYIDKSQSFRYDDDMMNVVGIEDYNKKKADKISGLEAKSDSEIVIKFKKFHPGILWGAGVPSEFINAKQFEGVAMDKVAESDALRKNPLSYGPYVVKDVVPGEKITYVANKHYYKGEPKIKSMEVEILPVAQTVSAIKSGKYDIFKGVKNDVYKEISELKNINLIARTARSMSYLSFKLGKWDAKKNEVVTDPKAKLADPNLRKALAYAIDNDSISQKFYHGVSFRANNPIVPLFKDLKDPKLNGYPYDMEKAKKLLDDAGYKDKNNDGLRETPKGEKLQINMAMMSGSEVAEPLSQYYLQQWKELGIDAKLVDDRLLEFNNFYEKIQKDDPAIDVYFAGWSVATNPDPTSLYSKNTQSNFSRYTSQKLQAALDKLSTNDMLDDAKRKQAYYEFEKVFEDEAFLIPQRNDLELLPINKRIKNFEFGWDNTSGFDFSKIEFVKEKPEVQ